MKIVVSSDNHLDVNRISPAEALAFQAQHLNQIKADYYLFAGDMFNDFLKTKSYLEELNDLITGQVFFIAGNHDMLKNVTFAQLESPLSPCYLHNQAYDFPNSAWRLIANNGWYDYSFSPQLDVEEVARWKKAYWVDAGVNQPLSDLERMNLVITQVQEQLTAAKKAGKRVVFLTHFVPHRDLLWARPTHFSKPRYERVYEMVNAFLGSQRLADLLEAYPNVYYTFYGHVHGRHPALTHGQLTYFNQAVGVRRRHEWQAADFENQWLASLQEIKIN